MRKRWKKENIFILVRPDGLMHWRRNRGAGGLQPPTFDIGGVEPIQNEADVTSRSVNVLKQESQSQRLRLGLRKRERSSDRQQSLFD